MNTKLSFDNKSSGTYDFIYGIKGIACLWVLIGHVIAIYKYVYGEAYEIINSIYTNTYLFQNNVAMFALLSGFLLANTSFAKGKIPQLIKKLVKRYIRFTIPISITCLFIVFIQNTVGYVTQFSNTLEYKSILKYALWDIFKGDTSFNGVFWMIGDIFWGGMIVIILAYLDFLSSKVRLLLVIFSLVLSYIMFGWVAADCVLGYVLFKIWNVHKIKGNKYIVLLFISQIIALGIRILTQKIEILNTYFLYYSVCFCIVIFCSVIMSPLLQALFSLQPFVHLGKISFGVYCLHYPILCSFTGYVIEVCDIRSISAYNTFAIAVFVTVSMTISCSIVFTKIEFVINKLLTIMADNKKKIHVNIKSYNKIS